MNISATRWITIAVSLAVIGGAHGFAGGAEPLPQWSEAFAVQSPTAQRTRGFGRVETASRGYQLAGERAWVQTFHCENEAKANAVIGKFLADLSLSPKVEAIRIGSGN